MTYEPGLWKAVCDRCGFEFKSNRLKKEWTGFRTCHGPGTNDCWEPRNTQEKVRGKADRQAVPWSRPEQPEIDVSVHTGTPVTEYDL